MPYSRCDATSPNGTESLWHVGYVQRVIHLQLRLGNEMACSVGQQWAERHWTPQGRAPGGDTASELLGQPPGLPCVGEQLLCGRAG